MPNQTIQYPNIDLPGVEFFGLAPNRTIALQGRRRILSPVFSQAIPGDSQGNLLISTILETGFNTTSGIYVHRYFLNYFPPSGIAGITLTAANSGLALRANFADFILGQPLALYSATPGLGVPLILDRDVLATSRDINLDSPAIPPTGNLFLNASINVNNTNATAETIQALFSIIYTRLDGFTE